MPIRSRQKKPNDEPRQEPNHRHAVVDPMVDPGSPPHRRQARAKADTTRTHHRMVALAQSSSGASSESPPQGETATVMLGHGSEVLLSVSARQRLIDARLATFTPALRIVMEQASPAGPAPT